METNAKQLLGCLKKDTWTLVGGYLDTLKVGTWPLEESYELLGYLSFEEKITRYSIFGDLKKLVIIWIVKEISLRGCTKKNYNIYH